MSKDESAIPADKSNVKKPIAKNASKVATVKTSKASTVDASTTIAPQTLAQIIAKHLEALQLYHDQVLQADEVEAIHKLRVTTRRLQAALDLLAIGKEKSHIRKLKKHLRSLRRRLSVVRNYDVFLEILAQEAANRNALHYPFESLRKELQHRRDEQAKEIRKHLAKGEIANFANELSLHFKIENAHDEISAEAVESKMPKLAHFAKDKKIFEHMAERLEQRLDEFLILGAQALPTTHPEELHQLRIAAKRLRYLLEIAAEMGFGENSLVLNWLRSLQDRIGEWHDLEAIEDEIIGIAARRKFVKNHLHEASAILASAVHLQKKKQSLIKQLFPIKIHRNLDSTAKRFAKALRLASQ
jgi:CHAD domain-containing protein